MATISRRTLSSNPELKIAAVSAPSRREFLHYIWAASMALFLGEATAGLLWFVYPRFTEGQFGGIFNFDPNIIPDIDSDPVSIPEGRFHVVHLQGDALQVLYQVCTHLGCIPKWTASNHRFECPCHGSKYELNGKYIEGPAPRSLDRFYTSLVFTNQETANTNEAGDPIPLEGREIDTMQINTSRRILRNGRT
jgi:cytochrome b6-f complex iron-sulfur subunit